MSDASSGQVKGLKVASNNTKVFGGVCPVYLGQACAPLWSQECGTSMFSTGICASVSDDLQPRETIAPTSQSRRWPALEAQVTIVMIIFGTYDIPEPATRWQGAPPTWTSSSCWTAPTVSTPGTRSRTSSATSSASSTSAQIRCRYEPFDRKHSVGNSVNRMNRFRHAVKGLELRLGFEATRGPETATRVFIESLKKVRLG